MLRHFVATVRAARRVRIVSVLAVAAMLGAASGCGIKGPLRPVTSPAPTTAPAAPEVAPSAPAAEPNPTTPRKP